MSNRKKIVIFEDDADIAELCSLILQREGYEVHHFLSVEDHITNLLGICPELILMDYMIPGGGGDRATASIKQHPELSDIKVLIVSASTAIEKVAKESGADGFIKKPFDLYEFTSTVKSYVN
jgi:CheY-like chemotaxis protein